MKTTDLENLAWYVPYEDAVKIACCLARKAFPDGCQRVPDSLIDIIALFALYWYRSEFCQPSDGPLTCRSKLSLSDDRLSAHFRDFKRTSYVPESRTVILESAVPSGGVAAMRVQFTRSGRTKGQPLGGYYFAGVMPQWRVLQMLRERESTTGECSQLTAVDVLRRKSPATDRKLVAFGVYDTEHLIQLGTRKNVAVRSVFYRRRKKATDCSLSLSVADSMRMKRATQWSEKSLHPELSFRRLNLVDSERVFGVKKPATVCGEAIRMCVDLSSKYEHRLVYEWPHSEHTFEIKLPLDCGVKQMERDKLDRDLTEFKGWFPIFTLVNSDASVRISFD